MPISTFRYSESVVKHDPRKKPINPQTNLQWACWHGDVDMANELLVGGAADPAEDENWAICVAAQNGHADVVERLLEDPRVDPSDHDNFPVKVACQQGNRDIVVRLLQDPRVDPSSWDSWALQMAAYVGHLDIVEILLQWRPATGSAGARVDPSTNRNYALRWAVCNGHRAVVERLLDDDRVILGDDPENFFRSGSFNFNLIWRQPLCDLIGAREFISLC